MRRWKAPDGFSDGDPTHRGRGADDAMTLTCRFVSPVFGGGAEPKKVDERSPVRASSIRGQLRFWWRATQVEGSVDDL